MNVELSRRHVSDLEERLRALGLDCKSTLSFAKQVTDFDSQLDARRWANEERSFLISRGCGNYPGANDGWFDEFLVEESDGEMFSLRLLELTIFYHLTRRPLEPSDVIKIGEVADNKRGYSHIFMSVPFFLPGRVNFIDLEGARFSLQWVMPILPREAEFISRHGADEFEKRLKASPYDYFDYRADLSYLD